MNYAEHYLFAIFFAKQHQQFCTFCQLRVLVYTDPKRFQKLVAIYIGMYQSEKNIPKFFNYPNGASGNFCISLSLLVLNFGSAITT